MIVCTLIFILLSFQIYAEFGWKVYKFVNCNPALRCKQVCMREWVYIIILFSVIDYYRVYEIFLSLVKMVIIFTVSFISLLCTQIVLDHGL